MSIKEENLITYSGTIKAGQRLVKVGNTFMPVGIGGAVELKSGTADTSAFESEMTAIIGEDANIPPVLVSGAKYYKCASVDTANKTWTGYEAYQDAIGIWTFSDTEMSLTYGDYFTPVVGKIYDATASIVISTLFDGIITQNTVFLLNKSLVDSSENNIQVVDKGLTVSNTGIMFTENGYAEIPAYALPSNVLCDNKDWTFEIKFRCTDAAAFYSQSHGCALYGPADEPLRFDLLILRQNNNTEYNVNLGGYGIEHVGPISYITSGDWLIHKVTHSSANEFKSYFNSEVLSTNKNGKNIRSIAFPIGCAITQGTVDRPGYPFEIEYIKISNVIE